MQTQRDATTIDFPSDRELRLRRVFAAPRRLLFDAWTNPTHPPHWMLGPAGWTMPVCEIDLRVGGRWHFVWRKADGGEMSMHGEYREIAPHARLVTTECWGDRWPETVNTLELSEQDGKTQVSETILYPDQSARDAARATGMTDGVSRSFGLLARYLNNIKEHI